MDMIKDLNWRYATKSFDVSKEITESVLEKIIEVFRLTASSFWLQPWKLIIIKNKELKEKLKTASYNQSQITEAPIVLVFARVKNIDDKYIENFIEKNSEITWMKKEDLAWYENMMKWYFRNSNEEQKISWARDQVFIALWNVMSFLAVKKIDSCAIWWFDANKYDEILELDKLWLSSVVVLPIWYRNKNDKYALAPKVRFDKKDIVIEM